MNEVTYALCKKQVIGIAMWLSSMCATNQALHDVYIDFSIQGNSLYKDVHIPMDEKYTFLIIFHPESKERLSTSFYKFICSNEAKNNSQTPSLEFELEIEDLNGKLLSQNKLSPDCTKNTGRPNTINFGDLIMKKGAYKAKITNKIPFVYAEAGKFEVLMFGVGAGYP